MECDVWMCFGDSIDIYCYYFVFNGVCNIVGFNWIGGEGIIVVICNGCLEVMLYVEKCFYIVSWMMMIEVVISGGLICDLYVVLGEELSDGSWVVCLYYKLFVCWIWYGGVLMVFGGLCCMFDLCYWMCKKL